MFLQAGLRSIPMYKQQAARPMQKGGSHWAIPHIHMKPHQQGRGALQSCRASRSPATPSSLPSVGIKILLLVTVGQQEQGHRSLKPSQDWRCHTVPCLGTLPQHGTRRRMLCVQTEGQDPRGLSGRLRTLHHERDNLSAVY